ncbi:NTP/NDP exchange transporter [Sphingomonas quercus]|uniref:MFS transporter n=1 Tax=Sphingomonas quercus TaxID=2842451 RepID=A0ABS6BJW6_9SPHN|nr:MFS transporter [Sphingomonas quercus]MBU3078560.1 MFS transporter [Sphingomonas quercus]
MTPFEGAGERRTRTGLARLFAAEAEELGAVIAGFLLFFLLFAGYFMLRPVRETMGIAGGVDNLQWLFLGTFLATLVVVPLYGWASRVVPRRRLLPVTYGVSALILVGFATSMAANPDDPWVARAFYIWISVFNLFAISIAWSLMADLFRPEQSKRLFGQIAAGASLGGLAGPIISGTLVASVGNAGLLAISAVLLLATLGCVRWLQRWRDVHGPAQTQEDAGRPIGGGILSGLTLVIRSPFLLGICLFVILLATVSTFLYFEQARLVEESFPDRTRQTQVFAGIDTLVQSLTILIQIFFTGRLARRLGVVALLTAVPLATMGGFAALAVAATFPVLAVVMVLRRVGEYALVRPGREMLFVPLDQETKYKAKNVIDTVIYRGGDAVSAWAKAGIDAFAASPVAAAVAGVGVAGLWAATGYALGRRHDRQVAGG